jgi:hypothetical protein
VELHGWEQLWGTKSLIFFCESQWNTTCMLGCNIFHLMSDGDDGMDAGKCSNRAESAPLSDKTKSLVLMNYFPSVPLKFTACLQHSQSLTDMVNTCYGAAGNRWANFIAVDYYRVLSMRRSIFWLTFQKF